jgi:hypothetical protein
MCGRGTRWQEPRPQPEGCGAGRLESDPGNWVIGGVARFEDQTAAFSVGWRFPSKFRLSKANSVEGARSCKNRSDCRRTNAQAKLAKSMGRAAGPNLSLHKPSARWVLYSIGFLTAALGFFVFLWFTEPATQPNPWAARLANATVSDATSLMVAVQTAGLRGTVDIRGAIEEIKRLDEESVAIKGWAIDASSDASSLTVMAFTNGKHVLTTTTSGARKDIARILGLSDAGGSNASFLGKLICKREQKLIVIAVTSGGMYSHFRSVTCP